MDRDKLAKLRKKSVENKVKKHQELLKSNASIKESIDALSKAFNEQKPYDDTKLVETLAQLKQSNTFSEDIKRLEAALKQSSDKDKLDEIVKAVGKINNTDVVNAVNDLIVRLEENTVEQDPEDFRPMRRVIQIAGRLIFDDTPTPTHVGGGGGGIQTRLIRGTGGDAAIAVVNPDGTNISGGGGGGGDATAANQVLNINELQALRGFQIPVFDEIAMSYTGDNLTEVLYKQASSTVATLTLSYTGSNLTGAILS